VSGRMPPELLSPIS